MLEVSEHSKREALATELADVLCRQSYIIEANRALEEYLDKDVFVSVAQEDEKSLRLIDSAINNFGLRVEAKPFTQKMGLLCLETIQNPLASELEKLSAYKLLKSEQMSSGHLIHKSIQLAQMDIKEAIGMFEGVQAIFVRHSNQIGEWLEKRSVQIVMGEDPAGGLVGKARDVAAATFGKVLSQVGKPAEEMSVLNLLRLDHHKTLTLFREIEAATQHQDAIDLYEQLRSDLRAHAEAEELTVYKYFQRYVDLREPLEDSWSEHEDMRELMDKITKELSDPEVFKRYLSELQQLVKGHIDEEEGDMFKLFHQKAKTEDLVRMAGDFSQVKKMIQEQGNSGRSTSSSVEASP